MPDDQPELRLGKGEPADAEVRRLLQLARQSFAAHDQHAAATALFQAHAVAQHGGLHRQAAAVRQALTILSSGGKPKLLKQKPPPRRI